MPHPERAFRNVQLSWRPDPARGEAVEAGEDSGWMRMFRNARVWLG
jgi:phosphoribosylformylglycinamidine synthase